MDRFHRKRERSINHWLSVFALSAVLSAGVTTDVFSASAAGARDTDVVRTAEPNISVIWAGGIRVA